MSDARFPRRQRPRPARNRQIRTATKVDPVPGGVRLVLQDHSSEMVSGMELFLTLAEARALVRHLEAGIQAAES